MLVTEVAHCCLMLKFSNEVVNRLVLFLTHGVENGCRLRDDFVRKVCTSRQTAQILLLPCRFSAHLRLATENGDGGLDDFPRCWAHDVK